mmetsp:Transcript_12558/g.26578  ORF Transcript_12558/g.26578 Transcript_12558/m.26578 type:complete len:269 (-) Transcript_12558:962-1768(-)
MEQITFGSTNQLIDSSTNQSSSSMTIIWLAPPFSFGRSSKNIFGWPFTCSFSSYKPLRSFLRSSPKKVPIQDGQSSGSPAPFNRIATLWKYAAGSFQPYHFLDFSSSFRNSTKSVRKSLRRMVATNLFLLLLCLFLLLLSFEPLWFAAIAIPRIHDSGNKANRSSPVVTFDKESCRFRSRRLLSSCFWLSLISRTSSSRRASSASSRCVMRRNMTSSEDGIASESCWQWRIPSKISCLWKPICNNWTKSIASPGFWGLPSGSVEAVEE